MKFKEWLELKESKIIFTSWIKDGRIIAVVDGKRKIFVTDAIHHDRLKKMNPELAYNKIIKLIKNGDAFEQ